MSTNLGQIATYIKGAIDSETAKRGEEITSLSADHAAAIAKFDAEVASKSDDLKDALKSNTEDFDTDLAAKQAQLAAQVASVKSNAEGDIDSLTEAVTDMNAKGDAIAKSTASNQAEFDESLKSYVDGLGDLDAFKNAMDDAISGGDAA